MLTLLELVKVLGLFSINLKSEMSQKELGITESTFGKDFFSCNTLDNQIVPDTVINFIDFNYLFKVSALVP
jgi:hypothetical protein